MAADGRHRLLQRLVADSWQVIRTDQMHAAGLTRAEIATLAKTGALHPRYKGIWIYATDRPPWQGVLLAAQWSCGADAYLTGRTALSIDRVCGQFLRRIEIAVPRRSVRARQAPIHLQRVSRPPEGLRRLGPLRYAAAARAILDHSAHGASEAELRRLIRDAVHARRLDHREMRALLPAHRGRPGIRTVLAAYGQYLPKLAADSGLESSFDAGCGRRPWIPVPLAHHRVRSGGILWSIDRYWPQFRVGVELQSRYHDSHEAREQDEFKGARLAVLGIQLLHFSEDRWRYEPESCLDDLEATLTVRGWSCGPRRGTVRS